MFVMVMEEAEVPGGRMGGPIGPNGCIGLSGDIGPMSGSGTPYEPKSLLLRIISSYDSYDPLSCV